MKTLIAAIAVILLLGSSAYGAWYVGPRVVTAYYPAAPVCACPAPAYAYYPAPVVRYRVPAVAPAPRGVYSPVVAPAGVWVAPRPVVVRGKVYMPGRPIRNVVRAILP